MRELGGTKLILKRVKGIMFKKKKKQPNNIAPKTVNRQNYQELVP